jgi:Zn-dependent M28 family amino/carboxypeptidase
MRGDAGVDSPFDLRQESRMKRTRSLFAALALATLAAPLAAQSDAPAFTADAVRAHVAFLADDLLEGRDTGSRGQEIAARYVATRFAALGLKPGGDEGTWYQRVTLLRTERGAHPGRITISGAGEPRSFDHGGDALIAMNPREPKLDVAAPLVFVGYGLDNARMRVNDYAGLDLRGRIAVALRGFPKGMASEEGAHLAATKDEAAQRHGAIGLIQIDTLQSAKLRPWARSVAFADAPRFGWIDAAGGSSDDAPGIRASASLNDPAAEALFASSGKTLAAIRKEADRKGGRPKGFALKTQARITGESVSTRVTSPNVAGILPGSDPALAAEVVVLSAHLDHIGISAAKPGEPADADRINNGALDNAAGIATMLEVARAAAQAKTPPRRSILFLAVTGEEKGLLGSDYYARHPTVPIGRIVGNVNLDMPLLLYPFTDVIAFGADHSTLGPLVAGAVRPMGVALAPDPMPGEAIFTRSDHYSFVRRGVPSVFLATGYANGGEKAWGAFLGTHYHRPGDDMSQAIDWQAGARFAEANYRIMRAMADADTPPLWYAGDFFGDLFAPQAARAAAPKP